MSVLWFIAGALFGMWLMGGWMLYLCIRYDTCWKCGGDL